MSYPRRSSIATKFRKPDIGPHSPFGEPSITFTIPETGDTTWHVYEPGADELSVYFDMDWLDPHDQHDAHVIVLWKARAILASDAASWGEIGSAIGCIRMKLAGQKGKEADNAAA